MGIESATPAKQGAFGREPIPDSAAAGPLLSEGPHAAGLLALQRSIGNRATVGFIQHKLIVGSVDDPLEAEADQVARQVLRRISVATVTETELGPDGTDRRSWAPDPPAEDQRTPDVAAASQPGMSQVARRAGTHGGPDGSEAEPIGAAGGTLASGTEAEVAAATGGRPLDTGLRAAMEGAFGTDFSGVRLHTDGQAEQLNRSMGSRAFTTGNRIFFAAGAYEPSSSTGQELLAHELTHVVQQGGAVRHSGGPASRVNRASRGVRRRYAALDAMGKARVDAQADAIYADKAREFELKMAPRIMKSQEANAPVDVMLAAVKKIVDAWAQSTGRPKAETYAREFGWAGGDQYYGAFAMTGQNIKAIFDDPANQPMRSKLKIVYNAVRNNNLQKWLKLAAIEIDRQARGKKARDWKIKTATTYVKDREGKIVSGRLEKEVVKTGFAAKSGLDRVISNQQAAKLAALAQKEKMTTGSRSKRDIFGHDRFSTAMNFKDANAKANKERIGNASKGLGVMEQNTLTVGDVEDLTQAEFDQLKAEQQKGANGGSALVDLTTLKATPTNKIAWSQGGEYFDIILGSLSSKTAAALKARMEAGISGSTDLMMNAGQRLGMNAQQLKELRLALAGWMMANRDHSFYEVYTAAEAYGVPFNRGEPGSEYEDASNLTPMKRDDFRDLLPEGRFPRYFLSGAYKDALSDKLGTAKAKKDFTDALAAQGIDPGSLATMDERAVTELNTLAEKVATTPLPDNRHAGVLNQAVRRFRRTPAYIYLGNTLGAGPAAKLLDALLNKHHFGLGVGGSGIDTNPNIRKTLADAGIPATMIDEVPDNRLTDLSSLYTAAKRQEAFPKVALARLRPSLGDQGLADLQLVLFSTFTGTQALQDPANRARADTVRRDAQLQHISMLAPESGWWFSWGNLAWLTRVQNQTDIFNLPAGTSPQGTGLYVGNSLGAAYTYGNSEGAGILCVKFANVPTIRSFKSPASQRQELQKIQPVDTTTSDINIKYGLYRLPGVPFLLRYTTNWGKLNTRKGVELMTVDLRTFYNENPTEFLQMYNDQKFKDDSQAKVNLYLQARAQKLYLPKKTGANWDRIQ